MMKKNNIKTEQIKFLNKIGFQDHKNLRTT
jgi:hypothetical protein